MSNTFWETLTNRVNSVLTSGILNIHGVDCSEVAEYLKKEIKVGRICTIRAFNANGAGSVFTVAEPQGVSEPYYYHTVLWYEHKGEVYIIDGTGTTKVLPLHNYTAVLKSMTPARFVYFEGYVADYSLKNLQMYKQKILGIY